MGLERGRPQLKGHSLLIIEDQDLLGHMFAHCMITEGMKVRSNTAIPDDLLSYMNESGIEALIAHTAYTNEEQAVLEAHTNKKKVVIIKRNPPATREESALYKRFEEAGIATVNKSMFCFSQALDKLVELFEQE